MIPAHSLSLQDALTTLASVEETLAEAKAKGRTKLVTELEVLRDQTETDVTDLAILHRKAEAEKGRFQ